MQKNTGASKTALIFFTGATFVLMEEREVVIAFFLTKKYGIGVCEMHPSSTFSMPLTGDLPTQVNLFFS